MKSLSAETVRAHGVMPVILGTDTACYAVARLFHQYYGLHSQVFGAGHMEPTSDSRILTRTVVRGLTEPKVFLETLTDYAKAHQGAKLVLVACGDAYSELVSQHQEELRKYYLFNLPTAQMNHRLADKREFYKTCAEFGIPYPRTNYCENPETFDFAQVRYPVVAKAADSVRYFESRWPGKRKVYIVDTEAELRQALSDIYNGGYKGTMIIQDFIPGDASNTMSLNFYSDQHGKVRMACLGQILLDDPLPLKLGNNNAIYTVGNAEIYEKFGAFFDALGYTGFANIDLKYDARDGEYKALETNLRLPASCYFMATGGVNFIDFYLRDVLELDFEEERYEHYETNKIWLHCDPILLKRYTSRKHHAKVKELLRNGYEFTIWYDKDRNFKRWRAYWRRRLGTLRHYREFGKEPDPS